MRYRKKGYTKIIRNTFLVQVCPEGSIPVINYPHDLVLLMECNANAICSTDQGQESLLRCYNDPDDIDYENLKIPLCKDGQVPDACNGCADGSELLHCPGSLTCELGHVPRWCGK